MADKNRYIRARERAGLSAAQAARLVGVSVDALKIVETAQTPCRTITNERLADIYGCSVEWLTGQVPYLDYAAIDRIPGGRDLPFGDRDALDMERRCENYAFGTSAGRSCHSCLHRYTRYDNDHPVPCFACPSFEERKETASYLPMACPICGRLRLELIDGGKVVRCEKCTTSSEWDGFTVKRYAEVADEMRGLAAVADEEKP